MCFRHISNYAIGCIVQPLDVLQAHRVDRTWSVMAPSLSRSSELGKFWGASASDMAAIKERRVRFVRYRVRVASAEARESRNYIVPKMEAAAPIK